MHVLKSSFLLSQAALPMAQQLQSFQPLQQLYLSSYAGNLTQFSFNTLTNEVTTTSFDNNCTPNPTWLTLDKAAGALFCLGENTTDTVGNGSVSSYSVCPKTGRLTFKNKQKTINGPVSSTVYHPPQGDAAIALAHYGGSAVSAFQIGSDLALSHLQDITFGDGSRTDKQGRQNASHAHEAILDPTSKYILVPDLGQDLVHVFSHDAKNHLTELDPLNATAGSGPRHAAFWSPIAGSPEEKMANMYFYLVAELDASLTGYKVDYKPNDGGLTFTKIFTSDTLGRPPRNPVAPAEVAVSPDNRFLLVSNRNDTSFPDLPNPDPHNTTVPKIPSDSISSWSLAANGTLENQQLFPAGGRFPRQFQINPDGDRVAVVLQNDNRLSILSRDVKTGSIGSILAYVAVPDQPTCVVWGGLTS